jgi:DNA-binding NtrC family response regulator
MFPDGLQTETAGFPVAPREILPTATVLVVDDEALIRWSLTEGLAGAGFQVLDARDGKEARQQLAAHGPAIDVVVLDVRLPDADGLRLLDGIKRAHPVCQVIILTAYGTPEVADEANRLGAFRMVSKPFNLDELVRLVGQAVASVRG